LGWPAPTRRVPPAGPHLNSHRKRASRDPSDELRGVRSPSRGRARVEPPGPSSDANSRPRSRGPRFSLPMVRLSLLSGQPYPAPGVRRNPWSLVHPPQATPIPPFKESEPRHAELRRMAYPRLLQSFLQSASEARIAPSPATAARPAPTSDPIRSFQCGIRIIVGPLKHKRCSHRTHFPNRQDRRRNPRHRLAPEAAV
jgi:hypothetical protein